MADIFGPTFGDEVHAAGLGGLPFSWVPLTGEISGREDLTDEQNTTLDSVIAAHDPTAAMVPTSVTNRQFFQAMAQLGYITQQEAMAAIKTGTVPDRMQRYIDTLPADQQFNATMQLCGDTTITRTSEGFQQYVVYENWSADQVNELFRVAGSL